MCETMEKDLHLPRDLKVDVQQAMRLCHHVDHNQGAGPEGAEAWRTRVQTGE